MHARVVRAEVLNKHLGQQQQVNSSNTSNNTTNNNNITNSKTINACNYNECRSCYSVEQLEQSSPNQIIKSGCD